MNANETSNDPKAGGVGSKELLACRECKREPQMQTSTVLGVTAYWVDCQCGNSGPAYYHRTQARATWNAYQRRQANAEMSDRR